MIRKLRLRFIAVAALCAAIVITFVSLGIVFSNRQQTLQSIDGMLTLLVQNEGRFPNTASKQSAKPDRPARTNESTAMRSPETPFRTRYFAAVTDENGNILRLNTDNLASLSEKEASALVESALQSGKDEGKSGVYYYRIAPHEEAENRTVVVFLNCEVEIASMHTLLRICILVSLLSLLLVTLLAFALSGAAIRPFVLNLQRQKEFVTGASHELKTPIAVIQSNVEVLELTSSENKWTKNIRAQSERLIKLAKDLTALAREDEERPREHFGEVDLTALAETAAEQFSDAAALAEKTLVSEIQSGVRVRGDGEQLASLLSILLDNAVKYADGGKIRFSVSEKGGKATIRTSNRCPVLPKDKLGKLFDRFYRADEAHSGKRDGFGLGLSIASAVVRAHGGKISAAQDADGILSVTAILP